MDGGSKAAPIHLKILFPPLRPPHSIEGDPSPPERGARGVRPRRTSSTGTEEIFDDD